MPETTPKEFDDELLLLARRLIARKLPALVREAKRRADGRAARNREFMREYMREYRRGVRRKTQRAAAGAQ